MTSTKIFDMSEADQEKTSIFIWWKDINFSLRLNFNWDLIWIIFSGSEPKGKNVAEPKEKDVAESEGKNLTETEKEAKAKYSRPPITQWTPELVEKFYREAKEHTDQLTEINKQFAAQFKKATSDDVQLHLNNEEAKGHFIGLLLTHTTMLNKYFDNRLAWIGMWSDSYSEELKDVFEKYKAIKDGNYDEFLTKIADLDEKDRSVAITMYFNNFNGYRNITNKALNKAEGLSHEYLKDFTPLLKDPRIRQIVNKDYGEAKKIFLEQDGYLRKKVSEVINQPK